MRTILSGILSALIFISCNNSGEEKKVENKVVSKHSDAFNTSVQSVMDSYHALTEAFVNWDTAMIDKKGKDLYQKLENIQRDTAANGSAEEKAIERAVDYRITAQEDLSGMIKGKDIIDKKHKLNELTSNLFRFLNKVQYDEKKIYLQECPMAFSDSIPGDWLSEVDSIRNPYMGLHHPHYGGAMIECGNTKSTIDFTSKK